RTGFARIRSSQSTSSTTKKSAGGGVYKGNERGSEDPIVDVPRTQPSSLRSRIGDQIPRVQFRPVPQRVRDLRRPSSPLRLQGAGRPRARVEPWYPCYATAAPPSGMLRRSRFLRSAPTEPGVACP